MPSTAPVGSSGNITSPFPPTESHSPHHCSGNMGNSSSLPLRPQPKFPRVVNQRFVDHNRMVSLVLDDQYFLPCDSQDSPLTEIMDADLDTVVFKVQRPSPNQKKLLLMDSNGVAAAALECFPVESKLAIYEATNPLALPNSQLLVRLETNFRPLEERMVVNLANTRVGGSTRIHFQGRWEDRDAWLFLDHASFQRKAIDIEYIVRVEPVTLAKEERKARKAQGIKAKPYKVTVAPGVDVAFVMLICAALDLEMAKKDVIFYPTELDVARLAERPQHAALNESARKKVLGRQWTPYTDA